MRHFLVIRSAWFFIMLFGFFGIAVAAEIGGPIVVELVATGCTEFKVTAETRLTYRASTGQWLPVENVLLSPERVWSATMEPRTGKLVLKTERGDRITSSRPIRLTPTLPAGTILIVGREYPGELEIRPSAKGVRFFNRVGLEEYTLGVLAGESFANWHPEALKAQAVAIRSYTVSNRGRHADSDFCDQPHCQRYFGVTDQAGFKAAVAATRGKILTYQGHCIKAFYHASSGGETENNDDIWLGEPVPYLRAVEDFDQACAKYLWHSPDYLTVPEFLARLGFRGWNECDIAPVLSEKTGNVVAYRFQKPGSADGENLSRETVRWRLGLFSPRFQIMRFKGGEFRRALDTLDQKKMQISQINRQDALIRFTFQVEAEIPGQVVRELLRLNASDIVCFSGKGHGHGVGLSQWGSQGLALKGQDYQSILSHYYGKDIEIYTIPSL